MKILITGTAGTGKTTMLAELQKRGYLVIDLDATGLCRWRNIETGEYDEYGLDGKDEEWFSKHGWYCDIDKLKGFLSYVREDKEVFVGGITGNIEELMKIFDMTFLLSADETILRERLTHRTNNNFGKKPHEQEAIVRHNADLQKVLQNYIAVDGNKPVEERIDFVLSKIPNSFSD